MHLFLRHLRSGGTIVCLLMASGCVMLTRDRKVRDVRAFPRTEVRPAICCGGASCSEYFNGHRVIVGDEPVDLGGARLARLLQQSFECSQLYSRVTNIDSISDYRIDFEMRSNIDWTSGSMNLTHFTLGLIPNKTRQTYELTAHIKNLKTGAVKSVKVSEGADGFEHLICLPILFVNSPVQVEREITSDLCRNMVLAVHDEILSQEQGVAVVSIPSDSGGSKMDASNMGDTLIKKLKALKAARDAGVITEQEYQQKRAELLKGL